MTDYVFAANKRREPLPGENPGKSYWRDHLRLTVPKRRIADTIRALLHALENNEEAEVFLVGELKAF